MSDTQTVKTKATKPAGSSYLKTDIDSMLVPGEQVVAQAEIHWGIYWQSVAVFILSLIVGLMVWQLGVLLMITAVAMFIYASVKKHILFLVLTNKRVLTRYGILQVDVVDIRFSKIESVELERMPTGYIMGYANLVIMGTGNRYITIPYVANAPDIRQAYNRLTLGDDQADQE